MATISTHTLNSVDGSHAGGIPVSLFRLEEDGARTEMFRSATDEGGRFSQDVTLDQSSPDTRYEMVLEPGPYFVAQGSVQPERQICTDVVFRFTMPDPHGRYHIPMMLAPNSYSVWWSAP